MIDLHSHILPGIDDGASSLENSIELARLAVQDGVSVVAATPHHNNGRYSNEASCVRQAVEQLNLELSRQSIPLTVISGQEIRINDLFWDEWEAGNLITLNESRYMLIELPTQHVPRMTWELIHELKLQGVIPIIAHPERNIELANNQDTLMELIQAGALGQVTSHSLVGLFGRKLRHIALEMCRRNLIHIVASDAHNLEQRSFNMSEAYQLIHNKLGSAYVNYYRENASAIASNEDIHTWGSTPAKSRLKFWKR